MSHPNLFLRERLGRFAAILVCASALLPMTIRAQQPHRFQVQGDQFALDGKPFQIISGEMHYPRIPRAYWRARLRMAHAMG